MNKPITMIRAEFVQNLVNSINTSELPLFIIESILKDTYLEVKAAAQRQYEADIAKYEQSKQVVLEEEQLKQNEDDSIEKC